ncbi:hypothetical protein [Rhodococcus qingshengii]|uniref:hypothetical protein n=1 Tax=Rhodococcus qingshengii TaxID=334542 RepID=UPI001C8BDB24|nr:hypothetical protein [Rhodococcus qingshengii]MBX9152024.1 hypothetical protein [Rhodococcus qingshengii]
MRSSGSAKISPPVVERDRSPTPAPSRTRRPRLGQCREVLDDLDDLAEVVRFGLSGGPAPGRRSSTPGRAQACYRFYGPGLHPFAR